MFKWRHWPYSDTLFKYSSWVWYDQAAAGLSSRFLPQAKQIGKLFFQFRIATVYGGFLNLKLHLISTTLCLQQATFKQWVTVKQAIVKINHSLRFRRHTTQWLTGCFQYHGHSGGEGKEIFMSPRVAVAHSFQCKLCCGSSFPAIALLLCTGMLMRW